jgi:polysaccharide export outer membrane protein
MMVYVIGRVNNPGRFVLNTNVNVLQVLSIAGGLNPFAKRSKIKILRGAKGQTQIIFFDYDDVIKGENLQQNIPLKRGDVVVVP